VNKGNKITDKGGKELIEALKLNFTLKTLIISDNKMSDMVFEEIESLLKSSDRFVVRSNLKLTDLLILCDFERVCPSLLRLCCVTISKHIELYDIDELKEILPEELLSSLYLGLD